MAYKTYYRRNLPHFQHDGATFLVNVRLSGSLTGEAIAQLKADQETALLTIHRREPNYETRLHLLDEQRRRYFGKFDKVLDAAAFGPRWLSQPEIARLVVDALHHRHPTVFELIAYTIMPNHAHLVISKIPPQIPLHKVMQSFKQFTAKKANLSLGQTGAFWQEESYDHIVRNAAELARIIAYVLNNPVKAGLVDDWTKWPYTYLNPDY
ncbi:MAG: transposase [Cytophagaceae bacterium]|nr:transposase [Cytophagaceae bacterium]